MQPFLLDLWLGIFIVKHLYIYIYIYIYINIYIYIYILTKILQYCTKFTYKKNNDVE